MSGILDPATKTTIANYARGAWDDVCQNNPLFAEFKKRGSFEYDVGGTSLEGPIEAGRYTPTISAPGMDLSALYAPKVRHTRWTATWAEIVNATVLDRGMLRRNSGEQALVKLKDTEVPALIRDAIVGTNGLGHQMLQLNSTVYAGSGLPFNGLPTFLPGNGYTGSATYSMATAITDYDLEGFTPPSGSGSGTLTGSAPADTDKEVAIGGSPTYQNYLGLSLKPGALTGVDGVEWDAWTPTLVNSSFTGWTGTADDEDDAIEKVLQYAVLRASRFSNSMKDKLPTMGALDRTFFEYLGAKKASRETIFVQPGKRGVDTPDSGYNPHILFHAGLQWVWDENMPSETAYVLNMNQMHAKIQPLYQNRDDAPIKVSGEDAGIMETDVTFDPVRRQYLVAATIPGQIIANPRYFVRVGNYS